MEIYFLIVFFIFGIVMGSFYGVVATRLPKGESIIYPSSHCDYCHSKLRWYDLIPLFSYLFMKGRCHYCKEKIPFSSFLIELVTGVLFAVCYHVFKFTPDLIIALIFVSSLIIVIVSDIEYMIILDEVIFLAMILILITNIIFKGFDTAFTVLFSGLFSFLLMLFLKIVGDYFFKKESLGGGDIKLMLLFGMVLGFSEAVMSIFLATFIAFPFSIYVLLSRKDHMIPFGPFLSIAALILYISGFSFENLLSLIA